MDKGHRIRLKEKNSEENWTLKTNKSILHCSKCRKYNTIVNDNTNNNTKNYIICYFCGNPNYIKK
jgi:hypothetical protein